MLRLDAPPIGITFSDERRPASRVSTSRCREPTPDGRTGRVPAGCVFWMKGAERTFTTVPEDHGNCSVGSLTHGLIDLLEAARRARMSPRSSRRAGSRRTSSRRSPCSIASPSFITYGPLAETPVDPDVVFIRVNGKQLMTIKDALPGLQSRASRSATSSRWRRAEGRGERRLCAVPRAHGHEAGRDDVCDPGDQLGEVVDAAATVAADSAVATYAGEDKRRFA